MTVYIGIGGPKGVGKDSFSQELLRWLHSAGKDAQIERLADPLYKIVSELTGLDVKVLLSQQVKNRKWTEKIAPYPSLVGKAPRDLLIEIGQDLRTRYGDDVLVQALKARSAAGDYVIVTDVRTDPEAKLMDTTIELSREGISYVGGATESGFTIPTWKIRLENKNNPRDGADFKSIAQEIISTYPVKV